MRASLLCLLLSAASALAACGGAIAPQTDDQQSTTTTAGTGKSGGSSGTRGTTGSDPGPVTSSDPSPPEPSACAYPPTKNPPGCPASYSYAYQGQPCSTLNLDCAYPGAGDFDANGCAATAGLWCRFGAGGKTTVWFATQ
jgi:hypothetical protein